MVRLLLVDDDPSLRKLLAATFDGFDVGLTEAGSASEALAALNEELPDAVVLDVAMPGVDGLALCRQLKSEGRTREIPVVLLTGSDAPAAAALSVGAEGYLRKPFRPLELLAVIERLAGVGYGVPVDPLVRAESDEEQLLLYAQDLRHLLELERSQRLLVQTAYRETIGALASGVEGHRDACAFAACAALRQRADTDRVAAAARRPKHGVRLPPARRGQDRDPG